MIGVLSDAHGNIGSYGRAIALIGEIGVDEVYFLGDAVGYLPSLDVLDRLMGCDSYVKCIRGNHEDMLIKASNALWQEDAYQLGSIRSRMKRHHLEYIGRWPKKIVREIFGLRVLFIHGSVVEPTYGYIYADSDLSSVNAEYDFIFMGNTHRPFIRETRSTTMINVGSCGLPRDDGRYGSFALFDPSQRTVEIMRYNIEKYTASLELARDSVHSSVREVLARRAPQGTLVGTVVPEES